MFCPVCRSEYRAGFTTCKNCGDVKLVEALPKKATLTEDEVASGKPVGFSDPGTARVVEIEGRQLDVSRIFVLDQAADIKQLLEDANVDAALVPLDLELPDNAPRFEVRVRAGDFDRAQSILKEEWQKGLDAGGAGGPVDIENCPACGAKVPLDAEECPDCGLFVGIGSERTGEAQAEE